MITNKEEIMKCSYCERDRNDKTPHDNARKLIHQIGLEEEFVNPGGRQIKLKNSPTLQLSDQCNWCDYDVIVDHIKANYLPNIKMGIWGVLVYDPRDNSWKVSDNPALVMADLADRKIIKTSWRLDKALDNPFWNLIEELANFCDKHEK